MRPSWKLGMTVLPDYSAELTLYRADDDIGEFRPLSAKSPQSIGLRRKI